MIKEFVNIKAVCTVIGGEIILCQSQHKPYPCVWSRTAWARVVPANVYWGAQTARSLIHFHIGNDLMPPELIWASGY